MKTDALFYELFRADPRSLFQLVQLNMEGEYAFESITVKTTEKRMDGFFQRIDGMGPNVFLEVQGYGDPAIYWRLFREICTWYEQSGSSLPFVAVALFVDGKYDSGDCRLECVAPCRLIRCHLVDGLKAIKGHGGALVVLKPLVLSRKEELPEHVPEWKCELDSLDLPENIVRVLMELLEYAILQRFPELTLKEVRKMIELTPLEETAAVKELMQIGREEARREGLEKGELIGRIQMAQRFLKHPITPKESLAEQGVEDLRALLDRLETQLQ